MSGPSAPLLVRATLAALMAVAPGCATTARPAELGSAERAYARAVDNSVGQYAAADLEAARNALEDARRAYAKHDVEAARDLAYVAQRRVELAEARANETRDLDGGSKSFHAQPPPTPAPSNRRGLMVPSDMGLGTGPAGPTTNGATPPAGMPPPGMPNGPP